MSIESERIVEMTEPDEREGAAPQENRPEYPTKDAAQKEKSDGYSDTTDGGQGLAPLREDIREFLRDYISYAVHLVAIKPDADPYNPADTKGHHFNDNYDAAASWAVEMNLAGFNVYWTVNVVPAGINKKPKKSDLTGVRFVHADLDPPKDGSAWSKSEKLNELQSLDFPPSFILDSGNGLGAFWRLDEEVPSWK